MPPSIRRVVSVHLKNIPWDLAFDVVLRTSGLAGQIDGRVLRVQMADPALGQDRVLMGTVTLAGSITAFNLQSPRSLLQINAPGSDGTMQIWPVELESAGHLKEIGVKPNTLRVGDQVIVTGNITRTNTIWLVALQRPSDGFSWGCLNPVRYAFQWRYVYQLDIPVTSKFSRVGRTVAVSAC